MNLKNSILYSLSCFLVFLALMACSGSDKENDNESIIGTWDWYETSGGIGGITETPQTTGETRRVVFLENGNVTFYTDNEITLSSTYTLDIEDTITSADPLPVLKVEGIDFMYIYSFPYVNELELQENVYDGFIHNYSRQ